MATSTSTCSLSIYFQVTALTYTDVLEYLYYGGMIWAKVNRLDKACELFELVRPPGPSEKQERCR
jgi:hypothetical protein